MKNAMSSGWCSDNIPSAKILEIILNTELEGNNKKSKTIHFVNSCFASINKDMKSISIISNISLRKYLAAYLCKELKKTISRKNIQTNIKTHLSSSVTSIYRENIRKWHIEYINQKTENNESK